MPHAHAPAGAQRAPLLWALFVTVAVALAELGGGMLSGSLALLADSAHVFMDAFALGIAYGASIQSQRLPSGRMTFGYARVEILAALVNGGLLFAIAGAIAIEAIRRFGEPHIPQGQTMAAIASIGFVANVGIGLALAGRAREDLNVKAALFHVASDAVGALAVVAGGILVLVFRVAWIDPLISLFVATIIAVGVLRIVREAADVLLESAPAHLDVAVVRQRMLGLAGVVDVHDLHLWTLGSGRHALAAHVLLEDARISEASAILRGLEARVRDEFDVRHLTLQFECESCEADERIVCTQPGL